MQLDSLVHHLDAELRTGEIADWSGALNGLQLENDGSVNRIGAAVDATLPVIEKAIGMGVDCLLVHHGLFWAGAQPVRGALYRKFKAAMDANLAIYSSHLPLDLHPTLGNNIQLATRLGLTQLAPFFPEKGQLIGIRGVCEMHRDELIVLLEETLGTRPHLAPGGPAIVREVGIVTGGAGAEIARAAAAGLDTFITGEGPHHSYGMAEELGLNLFYGGHYATETFGVKALARHVAVTFDLPWQFIDHPTGL
ncbi:MAG: Nif3-like dinuclear metal center hexameric protein [Chthoniobacterales bacterium]